MMSFPLSPYIARGFPGSWDQDLANVQVAGVDRQQCQSMIRLCPDTESILYGGFSPTHVLYTPGSRPRLEAITREWLKLPPKSKTAAAAEWVRQNVVHPHLSGWLAPDRGLDEENIIDSGRGWCNEQVRVLIALCEVMEIPARVCFLFHENTVCGHTAAEVYLQGRWCFVDVTFGVMVILENGITAEARDLVGTHRGAAHVAYEPPLKDYFERILPFVEELPGWRLKDRPLVDRGGDLLGAVGICNYLIEGVTPLI